MDFLAYSKVEICGVNTSKLAVLSHEEKVDLLKKIKNGDTEARTRFINGNLRLVLSVIQRFGHRGENPDDLFQIGCIGLIKAVNNFDITLNVRFSTYAVPMIIGEVRRYLRDNNSIKVGRSLRDTAYRALSAREALTAYNQHDPSIEEIAQYIGTSKEDVILALDAIMDPVSLFEPVYAENGDAVYVMDQLSDGINNDNNWLEELSIKETIAGLNQREKKILYLRFFRGHTQMQVASSIGISQAQVSRLEKNVLTKIKHAIR